MSIDKIKTLSLALLITSAIDSIRNLPSISLFGTNLPFFFLLGTLFFLIPTALISAYLSNQTHHSQKTGIYGWVYHQFGHKIAFAAIWFQWINTLVWYPTILSFLIATCSYLIYPNFMNHTLYLTISVIALFWIMTYINFKGVHFSSQMASFCSLIGLIIPMILIILLGLIWFIFYPVHMHQIHFHINNMIPPLNNLHSWSALTAIMTSFLGLELAGVHMKHIQNPTKTFPKALGIAACFIFITMIFGAIAIALVIPQNKISLVDGVIQCLEQFLTHYHLRLLLPILCLMIVIGSLGQMINWIISPAKGLHQAAKDHFLPSKLAKLNQYEVPQNLLILQAMIVSISCIAFFLIPSINGSYWFLTTLSTELYMIMYAMMFFASLKSLYNITTHKNITLKICAYMGLLGTFVTLWINFVPPESIHFGNDYHYQLLFLIGIICCCIPIYFFFIHHDRYKKF